MMLLLLIVSVLAQSDDEKCAKYIATLKHAVDDPTQLKALSPQTVMYSGKFLNDVGLYLVCRNQKDFRYIHLRMTTIAFMNHIGLCLPSYCHDEFLKTYNDETKAFINKQFQPAIKEYVTSADYQDPDNIYPIIDFGTVLVIIIVTMVVMVNLAASVASLLINAKRKKFEKQQIKSQESIKYSAKYSVTDLEQNQIVEEQEEGFMTGAKEQVEGKKFKEPSWNRVLKCFSFIDNIKKLFKVEEPSGPNEAFVIFNGIRGISILWVMFGHEELNRGKVASNLFDVAYILKQPGWITLCPGAFFAVDVFFFIGGFLSAVLVLDKLLKMKRIPIVMVPSMWLHRFLRVWPLYAFCLLVYWKLLIYLGGGPIWSEFIHETQNCDGTWWRNLLFIDNMWAHAHGGLDYCYGWGWYLAVDFQVFLITPIILIIYCKSRKLGMGVFLTILFGSLILSYIIAWHKDFHFNMNPAGAKPQPDYQDVFYYKPWIRVGPYIFGILFGLLYRRYQANNSPFLNKITLQIKTHITIRIGLYIVGIALIQWMIWVVAPLQADMSAWTKQSQYIYQAFSKVVFVFGVALCITPALLGIKNDPVRIFCGHPAWLPLARISFAMYLTHYAVILFTLFQSTQINYYQHSHILFLMISDLFYTLIVSTLVSVGVEVPCMQLEKILFEPKKKPQAQLIPSTKTADAL